MIEPDLSLQKPLEDFIELFEKLNPRALDLLDALTTVSLSLDDPYHKIQGREDVKLVYKRRFNLHQRAEFKVQDFSWGRKEGVAYIRWRFDYTPLKKGLFKKMSTQTSSMDGMSELMFLPSGQIFSIVEFWGAHSNFDCAAYAISLED